VRRDETTFDEIEVGSAHGANAHAHEQLVVADLGHRRIVKS
jgi:hypothetical protein